MQININVISTDKAFVAVLKNLSQSFPKICINQVFDTLDTESTLNANLLLIDIDTIKKLKKLPHIATPSVFIGYTAQDIDQIHILPKAAKDMSEYLMRPILPNECIAAIEKALIKAEKPNILPQSEHEIFVKSGSKYNKIAVNDLLYCEKTGDYISLRTINGNSHIISTSLAQIEEKLPPDSFMKIHRSFIINLSLIRQITEDSVMMQYFDKKIPVSRAHRQPLRNKMKVI